MSKHVKNSSATPESSVGNNQSAGFWTKFGIDAILVLVCVLLAGSLLWRRYTAVHDWALSYAGGVISGPLSPDSAAKYHAYYTGDPSMLYLTIDCGYENGNTQAILNTLEEYDVPAAFFLAGAILKNNPEAVQALANSGHIIGNHTLNHPDPEDIHSFREWEEQLVQVETLYEQITGKPLDKYCRPPEGRFSRQVLRWNEKMGYTTLFWNVGAGNYNDWDPDDQPTAEEALNTLTTFSQGGSVILIHNTSSTSAQILGQFIEECRAQGYTFGSLDELCAYYAR